MNTANVACTPSTQLTAGCCNQRWGAKLKGIKAWMPGAYALVDCAGKFPPGQVAS